MYWLDKYQAMAVTVSEMARMHHANAELRVTAKSRRRLIVRPKSGCEVEFVICYQNTRDTWNTSLIASQDANRE
jgi:hypothetical protein